MSIPSLPIPSSTDSGVFMIGVTGGTASGKTTICNNLVKKLQHSPYVAHISMDSFYRPLTPIERKNVHDYNFDIPDAFDWPLFRKTLAALKSEGKAELPQYSFSEHARLPDTVLIQGADVVVVEGILVLHDKEIREQFNLKIFVEADNDLRLCRRIKRDIKERGRTVDDVVYQYLKTVKPSFDNFILPTKYYADMVIPGDTNSNAILNLLCDYTECRLREISEQKKKRGQVEEKKKLEEGDPSGSQYFPITRIGNFPKSENPDITLIDRTYTPVIRDIYTKLREAAFILQTYPTKPDSKLCLPFSRSAAVSSIQLQTQRLGRLLISKALDRLCSESLHASITPQGSEFYAPLLPPKVFGVSIVRDGGENLDQVLTEMLPTVQTGHILVRNTTPSVSSEDLWMDLPSDMKSSKVILVDGLTSSPHLRDVGLSIKILLKYGVQIQDIILISLLPLHRASQSEWREIFVDLPIYGIYNDCLAVRFRSPVSSKM